MRWSTVETNALHTDCMNPDSESAPLWGHATDLNSSLDFVSGSRRDPMAKQTDLGGAPSAGFKNRTVQIDDAYPSKPDEDGTGQVSQPKGSLSATRFRVASCLRSSDKHESRGARPCFRMMGIAYGALWSPSDVRLMRPPSREGMLP